MAVVKPSERFFETNFCSQTAYEWHPCRLTWFTPSTNQERDLAFDTYVNLGGRPFFFQFKFPKRTRTRRTLCKSKHAYVQTDAEHEQLMTFRRAAEEWRPDTFLYAMPGTRDSEEIMFDYDFIAGTYFWDVLKVPLDLPEPTTSDSSARKSGCHSLNLDPECEIWQLRSEPLTIEGFTGKALIERLNWSGYGTDGLIEDRNEKAPPFLKHLESRATFAAFCNSLPATTLGLVVTPGPEGAQ